LRELARPSLLLAIAVIAVFLLLPSSASAQRAIPHAFLGSATINGSPAADGTVVAALVDGNQVAAKAVVDGTYPVLLVEPSGDSFAGKTVTFTIGGFAATETAFWIQGEVTELNLTAIPPSGTPVPTPILVVGEKGDPGSSGSQGSQGIQGIQGPAGPAGAAGAAGSAGGFGPAGISGPDGSQGLTGPRGEGGDSGSSLFGIIAMLLAAFAFIGTFGSMVWRRLVEE
jgi:hypothetical protein